MAFRLKEGTFATVPVSSLAGLHPYAQVLYVWLCQHANKEHTCFPSIICLAKETGLSRDSVIRYLDFLIKKGFVEKSKRTENNSQEFASNLYTVIIKEVVADSDNLVADSDNLVADSDRGSSCERLQVVADSDTNKNQLNKIQLTKPLVVAHATPAPPADEIKESKIYSDPFLNFWNGYPKKVGKGAAWTAWQKARAKPEIEKLLAVIGEQKKTEQWQKNNGQFIPNPATWLNQCRWDDEFEPVLEELTLAEKYKGKTGQIIYT
jgi:DNA-binding MarR family transcriptional regulator